ncbi:MAG TPA: hypothetical protein VGH91_10535 [Gammaproteobacteria bacterium]|jgi:hypothetical protein
MNKILMGVALILSAICGGCTTQYQPMGVDPSTGYLGSTGSNTVPYTKAAVSLTLKTDLGKYQGSILVSGSGILASEDPFLLKEMAAIGAFSDGMDIVSLQQRLITAGVQDKVPETHDLLGLNKAYRAYKPFLWVHFELVSDQGECSVAMIATDPGDGQDLFKANAHVRSSPGVGDGCDSFSINTTDDQGTWYPLFNSFIDWATANGAKVKLSQVGAKS